MLACMLSNSTLAEMEGASPEPTCAAFVLVSVFTMEVNIDSGVLASYEQLLPFIC